MTVPSIIIRGAHYEEGHTVALARGVYEDGHWLIPFVYGGRFAERPDLVSWLLGAVGCVTGYVPLWVARIPSVIALLAGAALVFRLVRQNACGRSAMFGAICFLISPMMLQKTVTAEVDGVVSVLLFAAFVVWWEGYSRGEIKSLRWCAVTLMLTAAGLVKGPQPLGYFFLGVGTFLMISRSWRMFILVAGSGTVAGAVIAAWYFFVYQSGDAQLWLTHSRLSAPQSIEWYFKDRSHFVLVFLLESLPSILLAVPLAITLKRQAIFENRDLALALLLYGTVCTMALIFWPGANGRYAMPSTLAFSAAAGLALDHCTVGSKWIVWLARTAAICLVAYALVLNCLVIPLMPRRFQQSALNAEGIARAVGNKAAILYVTPEALCKNDLAYIRSPVRALPLEKLKELPPPVFAIMTPEQEERLASSEVRVIRRFSFGKPSQFRCVDAIVSTRSSSFDDH